MVYKSTIRTQADVYHNTFVALFGFKPNISVNRSWATVEAPTNVGKKENFFSVVSPLRKVNVNTEHFNYSPDISFARYKVQYCALSDMTDKLIEVYELKPMVEKYKKLYCRSFGCRSDIKYKGKVAHSYAFQGNYVSVSQLSVYCDGLERDYEQAFKQYAALYSGLYYKCPKIEDCTMTLEMLAKEIVGFEVEIKRLQAEQTPPELTYNEGPREGDLQVWWIPQVPGKSFKVPVKSVEEARKILDVLADYDRFQFVSNIKPDYANAGGLLVLEPGEDGLEWCEWYDDETGEDVSGR